MAQIDHLGIAVKSLATAKAIYEKLGLTVSPEETVEHEQVRLVMVPVGESRLELLEATSEDSTIAKFIAKRGEGLHHVCLKVPDLPEVVERLKKKRRAARVGRNQNRRGRAPVRVCASFEYGRRVAGTGAGIARPRQPRISQIATDNTKSQGNKAEGARTETCFFSSPTLPARTAL
jgi:methylmalonyl-CoA epimerase